MHVQYLQSCTEISRFQFLRACAFKSHVKWLKTEVLLACPNGVQVPTLLVLNNFMKNKSSPVKVKGCTLASVTVRDVSPRKCSFMATVVKGSRSKRDVAVRSFIRQLVFWEGAEIIVRSVGWATRTFTPTWLCCASIVSGHIFSPALQE